jgi:hypothetical protein
MSKFKDMIIDIIEQYRDGDSIITISNHTGLPPDVVFDILKNYAVEDEVFH